MKEKIEIDENEIFEFLSITTDIQIKNFDVYRDTFFSHVEKVTKGETSKV